ncbi:MAG TPA: nitrilase-related carbon-nitrogen hydrolase [Tepidiformaceae bacterium]|nr:nitrilase-related carbon-nitrogen hydrolase [Tepidiformaceae bacterium]
MKPFRVALCQLPAYPIEKAEANLQAILAALDEAGEAGAQLVLLPECSYPAYYLKDGNPYGRPGVRPYDDVEILLCDRATRYGYWIAAGLALPYPAGGVTNSGLVVSPAGEPTGRYDKSFLWHFDTEWFVRGREFPVFDTEFGTFGILICADGRQPEIARSLAVKGAEAILDLTAWVSWGREMAGLSTTQCEYLMPVRARENGVWVLAADKFGPEGDTLVYAGRSSVIDPSGTTRFCAPADRGTVVVYDVEPMEPPPAIPRRPALYRRLTEPTESLPVTALLNEPLIPAQENHRVAVVPSYEEFDASLLTTTYTALRSQGADIVVFGGTTGPEGWQVGLPPLEAAVREQGGVAVISVATTGCSAHQSTVAVTPERTIEHAATHGRGIQLGEITAPVIPTAAGNLGLLCGDEGFVPEVARSLMLEGADILAWSTFADDQMNEQFARARSDENRVYTAVAHPNGAAVIAPTGAPLTISPRGSGVAMAAQVNRALSRWKDMAPGTNALTDRIPDAYGVLAG